MTHEETVILVRYVRACCPQQAMDEFTPDAWHDLLGGLSLRECREAVAVVARRQPFVAPAEVIAEVRRAGRHAADQRHLHAVLDPAAHRAQVAAADSAFLRKLAARTGRQALPAPPPAREDTPS
jgi:hypothetical protein